MKKITKIAIGDSSFEGGMVGFIFEEDTEKFPLEINFINRKDDGTFQFGEKEDEMIDYAEWKIFIENDPIKLRIIKDRILEKMKKEMNNY